MSTTNYKLMNNVLILLCLAVMTACAQRNEPTTQANVVVINHELDSMQRCVNEFDEVCPLGDTVAETDEGSKALEQWDLLLQKDTIDMVYARGIFSVIAHEMLLTLNARLDYDPDDQSMVEFDNQWRKFLLYWTDQQ